MSALGLVIGLVFLVPAASPTGSSTSAVDLPKQLTLEEAEKIAAEHQPSIRQAVANKDVADARAGEAAAPLWPQVSASATYIRRTGNLTAQPGTITSGGGAQATALSNASYDYFLLNGTVQQLIWDFGQTIFRWQAAEAQASAQQAVVRVTKLSSILNVRTGFFNARAQKDLVRVQKETLTNQERHLAQIQGFVEVGTRPDIDLVQARTDRANAQVQLINAENAYAIAKAQLNQAMGIESALDYDVSDETFPVVEGEGLMIDPLVRDAVKARPEISQIYEQLRSQSLTIDSAKGAYFPTLGASANISDNGPSPSALVWNWNVQFNLTWNIFQGFLTQQTVKEARANYSALAAQLDILRLSIRLEVEQANLAVRAAKAALGASQEALLNARERLRLAESRYETGVGNIIELGDAQVALTAAAGQAVSAAYNVAIARAQLIKALGRT